MINVAAGNHGSQRIRENATLSNCSENVVFRTVPGANVAMEEIAFASLGTPATDGADHVTVQGPITAKRGVACYGDCNYITIDHVDGGTVSLYGGPAHWTITNSDWGPCYSSGPNFDAGICKTSVPDNGQIELIGVNDIKFIGNTIHDYDTVKLNPPDHYECVRGGPATNIVFRGNKFWGCEIYALNLGGGLGGTNYIENNWFGGADAGCCTGMAITADPTISGHTYVRFNSFSALDAITSDTGSNHAGWHIIGNLIGQAAAFGTQCWPNAEYKYNIYVAGKCGDSTNVGNTPLQYVSGVRGPNMNYHLAAGTWLADNFVPGSQLNSDLAADFDGQARSAPRDAGSDER